MRDLMCGFGVIRPGDVTWAHAVNDRVALDRHCADPGLMMIEADISRSATGELIMAHPPRRESDLTFRDWIEGVVSARKGAKLDFKDPTTVGPCLEALRGMGRLPAPVFLNADILEGPGGKPSPFDPAGFVSRCGEAMPAAILSPGWTTGRAPGAGYTTIVVDRMKAICEALEGPVSFPVRASYLRSSWPALRSLLDRPGRTFTVWNSEEVDNGLRAWLRAETDPDRTFYDLIDGDGLPVRLE